MTARTELWMGWNGPEAKRCTYRVEWDEERLAYAAVCVEYPELPATFSEDGAIALRGMVRQVGDRIKRDGGLLRQTVDEQGSLQRFEAGQYQLSRLLGRLSLLAYRAKRDGRQSEYRAFTDEWHAAREEREPIEPYEFERMRQAAEGWRQRFQQLEPLAWPDAAQRAKAHDELEARPSRSEWSLLPFGMEWYVCRQGVHPLEDETLNELGDEYMEANAGLEASLIRLRDHYAAGKDPTRSDDSVALHDHYARLAETVDDAYDEDFFVYTGSPDAFVDDEQRRNLIDTIRRWTRMCYEYEALARQIGA